MIELDRIEGFQWDAGNARTSVDQRGASRTEAEQVFLNEPLLLADDRSHSEVEDRHHALGQTDAGRRLHVTFTLREGDRLIRVISVRDMHRKERSRYGH
jgi:uncharacterized protein